MPNSKPLIEDTNITLEFDEGRFYVYSGCNWSGGDYTVTETAIDFVSGPSTAVGCDTPILQQEDAYWLAQSQVVSYRVTNDRLELMDSTDKVTLVFIQQPQLPMNPADLVGTEWRLRAVSGENIPAGAHVTLNFPTAETFNGILGCIDYRGKNVAKGDDIWFAEHHNDYA